MSKPPLYYFHVTCPPGLEFVLEKELRELGIRRSKPGPGSVSFRANLKMGLKVLLWTRVGSRVLLELMRISARDGDELYDEVRSLPWDERMSLRTTFAIDVVGTSPTLRHTHFTGQRIKDGICDSFRDLHGARPNVDANDPDVQIVARLHRNKCTLSLDMGGQRLHRRGYRKEQVPAPLKETLAATIIQLTGWDGTGPLIDPMCGGGTFPIEAAWIATKQPPFMNRDPGCLRWSWMRKDIREIWAFHVRRARNQVLKECPTLIQGMDISGKAVGASLANAEAAGVSKHVQIEQGDARKLDLPQGPGVIVCNPPYGERLDSKEKSQALLEFFSEEIYGETGFVVAVLSPWEEVPQWMDMTPEQSIPMRNGKIPCILHLFEI